MKLTNQEEHIKSKMEQFNASVDTSELWQALEKHIPERNRNRKRFLWLLFPVVMGISGLSYIYIFHSEKQNETGHKVAEKDIIIQEGQINPGKLKTILKKQENIITTQSQSHSKLNTPPSTNSWYNQFAPGVPVQNVPDIDPQTLNYLDLNKSLANDADVSPKYPGIKKLPNFSSSLKSNANKLSLSEPILIPKTRTKSRLYLNIQSNTGMGMLSFYSNQNDDENYLEYLNKNSILKPTLGFDILIQKTLKERISFQTGLYIQRSVIAHRPKWERTEIDDFTGLSGNKQTITRQINYEAIGHLYQYKLGVPIQFDYLFYKSYNWKLSTYARVLIPVYNISTGYILADDLKLQQLSISNAGWFNLKKEPDWTIGLEADRKIYTNWSVNTGICYGMSINHYPYRDKNIKEKYLIYHFKLGLKYRLN